MAFDIGTLVAKVAVDDSGVNRGLGGIDSKAQATGDRMSGVFSKVAGLAATAFAGVGIAEFFTNGINYASDLNETLSKSSAIFEDQAGRISKWGDTASTAVGLSKSAAIESAANFGNLFTQLGYTSEAAADMSINAVQMAADLGSFNNLPTADVADRMSAAFRGEYDSLQAVIPGINAARVESEALAMTGKTVASELTAQEKAAAILAIIHKDGARAMGDFAKTSEGYANQSKIAAAQTEELGGKVGAMLLPVLIQLQGFLINNVIPAISGLVTWIQQNAHWLGPLATGLGLVLGMVIAFTAAQWLLNAAMAANPIGLLIVAVGLLLGAIILLAQNWDAVVAWISEVWGAFVDWLMAGLASIGAQWTSFWDGVGAWIVSVWEGFVAWITGLWEGFVGWLTGIVDGVAAWWNSIWATVGRAVQTIWQGFVAFIRGIWEGWVGWIRSIQNAFLAFWQGVWNKLDDHTKKVILGLVAGLRSMWQEFLNWINSVITGFVSWWNTTWSNVGNFIRTVWEGFVGFVRGVWDGFISWIRGVINAYVGFWMGVWNSISSTFRSIWSGIVSWANGVISGFLAGWRGMWSGLTGFFSGLWNGIRNGVTGAWNGVMSFLGGIPGRIRGFFAGIGTWLLDSGRALIQGFINGISGMIGAVGDAVAGVLNFAAGFFPNSPAKRGPFSGSGWTRLLDSGGAIMDQFTDGMLAKNPFSDAAIQAALNGDWGGPAPVERVPARDQAPTHNEFHYHAAEHQSLSSEEALFAALGSPRSPFGGNQ